MASEGMARRASYGPTSPVVGERGARTRAAIVEAALGQFAERGFHQTLVDDIANAVGISRAALYQYFESKEQLFVELLHEAGAALLRVVRRLGPMAPSSEGFDNLHWWLGEWVWVYDKYSILFVQWANVDSPGAPLRSLILQFMEAYTARMRDGLVRSRVEGMDPDAAAMVLLALINRSNYYRHTTTIRGLSDDELINTLAVVMQLVLFPGTPPKALVAHSAPSTDRVVRNARPARSIGTEAPPKADGLVGDRFADVSERVQATVRQLLDAGARVFGAQGYQATSVDDIVTAAALGRGTFYKYFDDKFDLLLSLAQECAERLRQMSASFTALPGGAKRPAALRAWLVEFMRSHRRYAGVFRVWLEQEPPDPTLQTMGREVADTALVAFDQVLGRVDRRYPFSVPAASLILLALLERLPDQLLGTPYDMEPEELAELIATVIERGLLNGRPQGRARAGRAAAGGPR